MKKVVPLLLAVAAGLWFLWEFGLDASREPLSEVEVAASVPEGDGALSKEALPEADSAGTRDALPVERELAAPEPDSTAADDADQTHELTGEVVLVDDAGNERPGLDGELDLSLSGDGLSRTLRLPVRAGRFTFDAAGVERVSVLRVVLDGRPAVAEGREAGIALDGSPLLVRVHLPPATLLSVLDDATGAHLSGVRVVSVGGLLGMMRGPEHPGSAAAERTLVVDGVSPLELRPRIEDARAGAGSFLVHAPGHAWKQIQLDLSQPGAREVRLVAGGELRVDVVGAVPGQGVALRLRRLDAGNLRPTGEFALAGPGPVEVDGLLPGGYLALLEVGEWWREPAPCGSVEAEVVAGERRSCTLAFEAPPERLRARLSGTLVVPAAWELASLRLVATYHDALTEDEERAELGREDLDAVEGGVDAWAFDFGERPTGAYVLRLLSAGPPSAVLPPFPVELVPGAPPLRLELPPPAVVSVRILDATRGGLAELEQINCGHVSPGATRPEGWAAVLREEGAERFELRAPPGELRISSLGAGYDNLFETAIVHAGRNELEYRLERDCTLLLRLMDGETVVPVPQGTRLEPEALDGEGRLQYVQLHPTGRVLGLSHPGRYRIAVPPPPGFAAPPAQEVEVRRGETCEVVFRLERE